MDYFSILNLNKEPFSNSPDPEYFFQSHQHLGCLQKLELSIRLKRGLNVVVGDVGTGKTTLCRQLIRRFADDPDCETHLILDPFFSTPSEFLAAFAEMLAGQRPASDANEWQVKETIKQFIFKKGVDEKKTIVLIIDEGQKIPEFCLETLREFLNFETNEYKLLQIVIFAQKELETVLDAHANVADRINLHHVLEPLNFKDTRLMIEFRVNQSREASGKTKIFSYPALWAIYRATQGYPRKIVNLCHRVILAMIIQNRPRANWSMVRSCASRVSSEPVIRWRRVLATISIVLLTVSLAIGLAPDRFGFRTGSKPATADKVDFAGGAPAARIQEKPHQKKTVVPTVPPASTLPKPLMKAKVTAVPEPAVGVALKTISAEKILASSAAVLPDENKLPEMLGQVTLEPNESIWRLIEKVYGVFDNQYLNDLKEANPGISDPRRIEAGSVISIPAIPATVKALSADTWWVQLSKKERLENAIQTLRTHPENAPPIRLIPYWKNKELSFAILLRNHFSDGAVAAKRLKELPPAMAAGASILSSWDPETVFFADPYRIPRK